MNFRTFFYSANSNGPLRPSPLGLLLQGGINVLLTIAVMLTGLGVLMLLFPLALAIIVASLFFAIAFVCLTSAWRIYRQTRPARSRPTEDDRYIHVEIIDNKKSDRSPN